MKKNTLYIIIMLLLGGIIIASSFFITLLIKKELNDNLVTYYTEQEELIADQVVQAFETEIENTNKLLTLLGSIPTIKSGSTVDCNAILKEKLTEINSPLGNVGRVTSDGVFHCSINSKLVGTVAANLGPYMLDIFNDSEHKPVMSRAILAPGAPSYLVAYHVPIFGADKEFLGTLGGALYLNDLQEKYLKKLVFAKRGFVALFDDNGTILSHRTSQFIGKNISDPMFKEWTGNTQPFQEMLKNSAAGKSGTLRYQHKNEGEKVAAYKPISVLPGRTWTVLVTVPIADVRAEIISVKVDLLLNQLWILSTITAILTLLAFIYLTVRFVFKPMAQINQMKSDFVSLVSHQLKTPVAQIKGYVQNILDGLTGPFNDKQRDYFQDMLKVADKNSKLIDDLLNVSRLERGMIKLNSEKLGLTHLIEEALSPLYPIAQARSISIEKHPSAEDLSVLGDPIKTIEAIRNIIDNALKFSKAGQKVTVTWSKDADFAMISISDQGPGIDPDVQTELFAKNRIWAGKVKASGAGLGLFLSKQFIELGGGHISFKTGLGTGTTFFIKLPKA